MGPWCVGAWPMCGGGFAESVNDPAQEPAVHLHPLFGVGGEKRGLRPGCSVMRLWNERWAQRPSQTAETFLAAFLLRIAGGQVAGEHLDLKGSCLSELISSLMLDLC